MHARLRDSVGMHIWEIVIVEFESKPCKLDKALLSSYQPLIVEKSPFANEQISLHILKIDV